MAQPRRVSETGIRIHQFTVGALPVAAYLANWLPPVWVALALSTLAVISPRLLVIAGLCQRIRPSADDALQTLPRGYYRFDEGVRLALLACGLGLLASGRHSGWLPLLAASCIGIMAGTTGFSFTMLVYAIFRKVVLRVPRTASQSDDPGRLQPVGNPKCLVCRALSVAPYHRCRWCNLPSVRWCCGLQSSMLLVLLLVIAFLLNAMLAPWVTRVLVTMSIVGVVALALAINRQTEDLVAGLDTVARAHAQDEARCEFLKCLSLVTSVQEAAERTIDFIARGTGARRISLMLVEDGALRIAAARGIPEDVIRDVRVPIGARICGRVFAEGVPIIMQDVAAEFPREALGLPAGSAASYPIVTARLQTKARPIGVVNVTDHPAGAFTEDNLADLQFAAEAAAISLSSHLDRDELERANYGALRTLAAAVEAKDLYTHGHSERVLAWAIAVAAELGLAGPGLRNFAYAAELHDIGKLAVPDHILQAPRRLTEAEFAIVREHPRRGVELIQHLNFLTPARPAILYHHEKLDGTGYPEGLAGDQIPLEARILAVVDAYDAMTSVRPYRPAMCHEEAVVELRRCTGAHFDPACVETFLRLLGDAPEIATAAAAPFASPVPAAP